jgi:hypothetical protein
VVPPGDDAGGDASKADASDAAAAHLLYFGYWRDSDIGNHVCELQDHSNYSMTGDQAGSVDHAATYGVANWGTLAPSAGSPPPLGGCIVLDDADWPVSIPEVPPPEPWAARKKWIEDQAAACKKVNPSSHPFVNFVGGGPSDGTSGFRNMKDFEIPAGIEWIGLECYKNAADCKDMVDKLKAMPSFPSTSRFWPLIPAASFYGDDATLAANAQAMYDWALTERLVIGFMGFVWSKAILCPPDCGATATKEMPTLLAKMRTIGDAITGRTSIAPLSSCP